MKPGENLQRLVAAIERSMLAAPNVKIQSPAWLRDKDTGRRREHDWTKRV